MDKYEETAKKIVYGVRRVDLGWGEIADILREAFPEPSDKPQAEASDDDLDITTINKIDKIFHGLTDHGDPMIRMSQARAVMARHDAQLLAACPAPADKPRTEASKERAAECMDCEVFNEAVAAKEFRKALEKIARDCDTGEHTEIARAALATPESDK